MKQTTLRDLAKFLSGLIFGDFLALWWFSAHNFLPIMFMGVTFGSTAVAPALIFDGCLFIMLMYYGWHLGKMPALRERTYHLIAGIIFGVVAFVHLVRAISGSDFVILNWYTPTWLSWVAVVASGLLSYMSFHFFLVGKRK